MGDQPGSPAAAMAQIADLVQSEMRRRQVPGAAVALRWRGVEQAAGFGVGSIETRLAVDASTLFQCGSITKTFATTAILRLVEQGTLSLHEPVRTYLPDLRLADAEAEAGVTLFHLLTHAGGWYGDHFEDHGRGADAVARYVADLARLPQLTPLGRFYSYCNAGFSLAGRVVEVVTGKAWEAVIRELVFEPLGLTEAFLHVEEVITRRFAVGHLMQDGRLRVAHQPAAALGWRLAGGVNPAGGIGISARDLLRYGRFHLRGGVTDDGVRLLSAESMALMQQPQMGMGLEAAAHESWSLGWSVVDVDGVRCVSHGGGTSGQISLLLLVPERDFALVVLTNASTGSGITEGLRRWTLDHLLGLKVERREPIDVPEAALQDYTGTFMAPGFRGFRLELIEGVLQRTPLNERGEPADPSTSGPTVVVAPFCTDRLIDVQGLGAGQTVTDILRDEDGNVSLIRVGGRIFRRLEPAPAP